MAPVSEGPDEGRALPIFWVPPKGRWQQLKALARRVTVVLAVGRQAMACIERENPQLKGVPPQVLLSPRARQGEPRSDDRPHQQHPRG